MVRWELLENKYIFINSFIDEKNVTITIKDNAGGIPETVLPRIFDAYYTTKHKTQGTGLGLYMTYNFISVEMSGEIIAANDKFTYKDTTYSGALFTITLPFVNKRNNLS